MTECAIDMEADDSVVPAWRPLADAPDEDLYQRNKAAFLAQFPEYCSTLSNFKPTTQLVVTDDGDLNVKFNGTTLYAEGALAETRAQLDHFWRNPQRVGIRPPDSNSLDPAAAEFAFTLIKDCVDDGIDFVNAITAPQSYFLFCFGVGLGPHLDELVETSDCRMLVIIEPNFEFIHQSMYVFDWCRFLDRCKAANTRILINVSTDPMFMSDFLIAHVRGENPAAFDGSYIYQHYANSGFTEAQAIFSRNINLAITGLGFISDEVLMMRHTVQNLMFGDTRVIRITPAKNRQVPVFIIASGPSLDGAFKYLQDIQHKAVLVAAGSAIEPLLVHGIQPHFHVLLENEPDTLRYENLAKAHDMSGVCLVASTTCAPKLKSLYKDTILFFRPALSPLPAFASMEAEVMQGCDPAVSNAAVAFAIHMGFRTFYFCGMDLGKPDGAHHHSRFATIPPEDIEETRAYDLPIKGNFGGKVRTDWFLDWTRNYTEKAILAFKGRFYYNCSEGVAIRGTIPKRIHSVKLAEPTTPVEVVADEVINDCPIYSLERFAAAWAKLDMRKTTRDFFDNLVRTVDEASNFADGQQSRAAMDYLTPGRNIDCIATFYRGTIYQMLITVRYYRSRLARRGDAELFDDLTKQDLPKALHGLASNTFDLADELEAEWESR